MASTSRTKAKPKKHVLTKIPDEIRKIKELMVLVETKESPTVKTDGRSPMILRPTSPFFYEETSESKILKTTLRSLFSDKVYRFRISTVLNMVTSAAGAINSTLSNSALVPVADFVNLSSVFNEYYVQSFRAEYMPVSRYQYLLTGTSSTTVANLPMGIADLQHGQAAYSNLGAMSENFRFAFHSTGDPFTFVWKNTEIPDERNVTSLTAPTQSWNPVNNASNYQGTIQFLSQSAPPGLPTSQVVGTFAIFWDVLFRVRS